MAHVSALDFDRTAASAYALTSKRGYRWEQTETEAVVWIALADGVKTKTIDVEFHVKRISVTIAGDAKFVDEELHAAIDPDESFWEVEEDEANDDVRSLKIVLCKRTGYTTWSHCLASENVTYEIDRPTSTSCFLDVAIDGVAAGRITVGLWSEELPRTCTNFATLCSGERADDDLHYEGSAIHRVIPGFMLQGGDFTKGDGTGGVSIYGERFDDEAFCFTHAAEGLLSMANAGPDTNGSQFFITCKATPHLDGKHVVFGKVIEGLDVVKAVEALGSADGTTAQRVTIAACGVVAA